MLRFEQYLEEFNNAIVFQDFLVNIIVVGLLTSVLRIYYIRYGNSITNRKRFSSNFMPLGLTTMLIITIVKSSIALSLGLVGALSIVRFRAAIKDPEELTFLFLVIGIGLASGANQSLLGIVAMTFILLMLYISKMIEGRTEFKSEDKLYVNISTDVNDLEKINQILSETFHYVELKRLDTLGSGLDLAYICKAKDIQEIEKAKNAITALSELTTLSIVDQPDLIV
ncbi:MAG: DUF4956 domain-containing protein [Saprospiraceae bacterium]